MHAGSNIIDTLQKQAFGMKFVIRCYYVHFTVLFSEYTLCLKDFKIMMKFSQTLSQLTKGKLNTFIM